MRKTLIRLGSSVLLTAALGVGLSHAAGASISNTGPDSNNQIILGSHTSVSESNHNDVDVSNNNHQTAISGDAIVSHNTWGGDATSGDASNHNSQSTNVSVSNGSLCCVDSGSVGSGNFSISDTGPDSVNRIVVNDRSSVKLSNHNDVDIDNSNHQTATSGDAVVSDNTHGGDAVSGDAWNDNSGPTRVEIENGRGSFSGSDKGHGSGDWSDNRHRVDHERVSCCDREVEVNPCHRVRHLVRPPCEVEVRPCHLVVPCHREVRSCDRLGHEDEHPCHWRKCHQKCHPVVRHCNSRCHQNSCWE